MAKIMQFFPVAPLVNKENSPPARSTTGSHQPGVFSAKKHVTHQALRKLIIFNALNQETSIEF